MSSHDVERPRTPLKRHAVNALALFGGFSLATWLGIAALVLVETRRPTVAKDDAINVSPVASRLASRFSPQLQRLARDHREGVIGSVEGAIQRWCVGKVYEPAVEAIPKGTAIASEAALNYLCNVPPREFAADLIEHAKYTGRKVDYRVWQAAEGK